MSCRVLLRKLELETKVVMMGTHLQDLATCPISTLQEAQLTGSTALATYRRASSLIGSWLVPFEAKPGGHTSQRDGY
jgi:hypothetical protein